MSLLGVCAMQTGWRAPLIPTAFASPSERPILFVTMFEASFVSSAVGLACWIAFRAEVKSKFKTKTVKNKENPVQFSVCRPTLTQCLSL